MKAMDPNIISIDRLHELIGGRCNPTSDFLVCMDVEKSPAFVGQPFRSPSATILICTEGSFSANVNMNKHWLTRGSVLLYGPDSIVEFDDVSDETRFYCIVFARTFVEDTLIDLKSIIPIFKYIIDNIDELLKLDDEELVLITKFVDLLYSVVGIGKRMIIRDVFAALVRTLGEIYNKRLTGHHQIKTRQEDYFERFLKLVTARHRHERSVKYYADALHITPKYLSTIIKEISGKSATSWINDFVIQQAKIMLKFSGKSIQEITYELNFSTQSFFGKYFKRHTGMSPSEYRQID